jgi:hypothetical protein
MKLFTTVMYCPSTVIMSLCVANQYNQGKSCCMALHYCCIFNTSTSVLSNLKYPGPGNLIWYFNPRKCIFCALIAVFL